MGKIFYGWWIVAATGVLHLWGAGTFFYSFTAFFNPIVEEFGWSYTATSLAASIRGIEGGIASPIVGFATDRFGARRLLLIGSFVTGSGFLLLSRIDSLLSFYLLFIFLSAGSSLLFPIPGWTVTANWFLKKRGTAIGILSAAIGLGGGLIYLVNTLIGLAGWRATLVIIGLGTWVLAIPCSLIIRNSPEECGLSADGERNTAEGRETASTSRNDAAASGGEFSVLEAIRTKAFWGIALAVTVSASTVHAVTVHVMPYFISVDFSREEASIIASVLVFTSIAGRFGLGWLSNHMDNRRLLAFGIALQAVGLVLLAGAGNAWFAALFVVSFGPGYGGVITLRLTLQAQYFGRRAFGAIQGAFMAIMIIGTISSPLLTGLCYDVYGDYSPAWLLMAAANLAIVPFVMKIRPPKRLQAGP